MDEYYDPDDWWVMNEGSDAMNEEQFRELIDTLKPISEYYDRKNDVFNRKEAIEEILGRKDKKDAQDTERLILDSFIPRCEILEEACSHNDLFLVMHLVLSKIPVFISRKCILNSVYNHDIMLFLINNLPENSTYIPWIKGLLGYVASLGKDKDGEWFIEIT